MRRSIASIRRRFSGGAYASSPLPIAFPLLAFVSHLYHLFVLHDFLALRDPRFFEHLDGLRDHDDFYG
jgi:hypothetical protein